MARIIKTNTLPYQKTDSKISVSDIYSKYLRVKKAECAENTLKIYADMGTRVYVPGLVHYTGNDMNKVDADVLRSILDDYSVDHEDSGVQFVYRHLRSFINWYWNEYDIARPNPMRKVNWKKCYAPPKEGITQDEVNKLLKAIKEHNQFPERDTAFILLLCDTGIRKSSIANLRMKDVNLARSELVVFEKDQQYHTKPFGATTAKALKKYFNCLEDVQPDDPLWLSMDGTAINPVGMREILRRGCQAAGIPVHQFHDFRRYYGKQLYETTHDIYTVSRALDHKSIEVTKRYLAIDDMENAEAVRSYSPIDRVTKQTRIKINRDRTYR